MENDNKKLKKLLWKKKVEYYCKKCDFKCSNKNDYRRHKLTAKHLKGKHGNIKNYSVEYFCDTCGKGYKHRSGLSRHKKKCFTLVYESVEEMGEMVTDVTMLPKKNDNIKNPKTEILEKDAEINALKIEMLEKELKHKDQIIDILKTKGNTTNNNTQNFDNNTFNTNNISINLYLNEHCKNAMNLTDFVDQIKVQLEDIMYQDRTSSADGLTNIITKQLKDLAPTERPIHCSDQRRQHFYIKEGEEWKQKSGDAEMEKSVRKIQIKQLSALKEWEDQHPNFMDDERLQTKYTKFMEKIMYGCGDKNKMEKNVKEVKKKISQDIMIKDAIADLKEE